MHHVVEEEQLDRSPQAALGACHAALNSMNADTDIRSNYWDPMIANSQNGV
jgi:hypothetical protein